MHLLETATIAITGLMVGTELAVSVFFNPGIRKLDSASQAHAFSIFATTLGRAMPPWYGLCLALLGLESYLNRSGAAFVPLLTATLILAGLVVFSITLLVPINNRIAALQTASAANWNQDHRRWDALHRVRVLLLLTLFCLAIYALVR